MSTTDTVEPTTEVDPLEGKRVQLIIDVDLEAEAAAVVGADFGITEEQARSATAKVADSLVAVREELYATLDQIVANGHEPTATLGPDGYGLSFSIGQVYLTGREVLSDDIEADRSDFADDPTALLEELFGADVVARAEEQARQILGDAGLLTEDE